MNNFQHIHTLPETTEYVELLLRDGTITIGHFACDLSGEEQPPFKGLFVEVYDPMSFEFLHYRHVDAIAWRKLR